MFVDFHSHILPRADHGSDSIETSLLQLQNAAKAGVDTIIATPHYYIEDNTIEEFLDRREKSFLELSKANDSGIEILRAAEVQIAIGVSELPDLPKLCIEGTNYILLEFPPEPWPYWIYNAVGEIRGKRGLVPICVHIDRYSPRGCEKILKTGAFVQINASAFSGFSWRRRYFSKLISEGSVHLLGSDAHGDGSAEYGDFAKAAKKLNKLMPHITENSRKILAKSEQK